MKKLGDYLLESQLCDEALLHKALEQQALLSESGEFRPLGSLLTDAGNISPEDLKTVLDRMHTDILSSSSLFKDVPRESIKQTVSLAEHKVVPGGAEIFRAGDRTDAFFIITSGRVQLSTTTPEGNKNLLADLKEGGEFGVVSLLTGKPRTATARAVGTTSLLILSKEFFNQLCLVTPEFSMAFIRRFADRLVQKQEEIAKASENERAYQQLVSEQNHLAIPELLGQKPSIRKLRKKLTAAAQNNAPLLIQGEPGTEKLIAAATVHKESGVSSAPFLSMDAGNIELEGYGMILERGAAGELQMELAQRSVLFGCEADALSFSKRGLGLLEICRQGTVVIQHIDKLTKGVQQKVYSYLTDGTFITVGGQQPTTSNARLIATSSADLEKLTEQGKFNKELLELLRPNSLVIPPLRKRKSDLRLLVDFIIIMECFKVPGRKLIKGISPKAYQRIMAYDWPGNMEELQVVIRRAISLAKEDYLMPEDIFLGMIPPKGKYTFNLLQLDSIRNFFRHRFYPVGFQIMTGSFFALIFFLAFTGNQSPDANITLLLVWALWWPTLAVSWFFGARIWCAVCPMGAANDLFSRLCSMRKKVPDVIVKKSAYFSAAGLALIIYAELSSNMVYSPMATGFLLLTILSCAVLSGILYERRVWCRYICPLGRLAGTFSGCAVVEWRSNSSICNSTCTTNACYKGNSERKGCPLYQGPFSLYSNQNCILCGNCVKICENASPAFNIRIPGHELWSAVKPEKVTAVFVPVILATQVFRGLEDTGIAHVLESALHSRWLAFAVLLGAAVLLAFPFIRLAAAVSFGPLQDKSIRKNELFVNALVPLLFSFEIGYHLKPFLERLGHFFPVTGREFGFQLEFLDIALKPGAAKPWEVLLILTGMFSAIFFLKKLRKTHQENKGNKTGLLQYFPLFFISIIYIWMFLAM